MRKLVVLRGLPGSGKSTVAKQLGGLVCSADDYFMRDGEYKFDPFLLGKAHKDCRDTVELAMYNDHQLIVLDNTNTQKWEYEAYLDLAKIYGYEVEIKVVGGLSDSDVEVYHARQTHGVPLKSLRKMAARFEP
jgi:predicted kinase